MGVCRHKAVSYSVDMTTKGTPGRMVRIDDETWAEYGQLCDEEGTTRGDDLRRHAKKRVNAWKRKKAAEAADLTHAAARSRRWLTSRSLLPAPRCRRGAVV